MAQLSLTEVSKRFKVNRTTIYRSVSTGKLSRLDNGLFDLAEVLRVFGEAPANVKDEPKNNEQSKLVEVLERELLFLKNQIEQKDKQINSLQLLLGTSVQRPEATQSYDTGETPEIPIKEEINKNDALLKRTGETNNNDAEQHKATIQNDTIETLEKPTLIGRIGRGVKAFLK
ncbi:MAG: plasmid replication DNA-binding protein [Acinetobacter sp.]